MKWFEASINEAVATSKSRKAIFVVFVEGKDDTSKQVAEVINATEVSSRLEQDNFVAIRLESGSETYSFFAEIYRLVPVPSIFFIGENGTPLEVVAGSTTVSDLVVKIDGVLAKAGKTNKNASHNLIDAEQKATTAAAATENSNANVNIEEKSIDEQKVDTKPTNPPTLEENVPANDNDTTKNSAEVEPSTSLQDIEKPKPNSDSKEESQTKELTPEEKRERARQLIEIQRKQRVEEEGRRDKDRELERRRTGREVQKGRQRQQDLEIRQAEEERRKEKAAEAEARMKVRQQIAQDKLERKQKELALQQQMQKQSQNQEQPKVHTPAQNDTTVTRIQFRLPSGTPHMGKFEPTSTLGALRNYIVENIDLPSRQFAMSISFPRRDLTHDDDDKTLLELELVPTAVILILPLKNSNVTSTVTSAQDVGFVSRFMWSLFAPVIGVYNYLVGYFSGGTQRNTERQRGDTSGVRGAGNNSDGTVLPNLQNVANSSGLVRRYLSNQKGTTIKAEGNIHRLHSGGDDNDENNTWNGNSTQQM